MTGAAATSLSVTPTTLTTQPVANPSCPAVPPFNVPFQLFVQAGDLSTSITNITMQFGDRLGVQMPPVTLPAPALTAQFGSMLVQARSVVTLPLSLSIGCGTGLPGTLVVIVSTRDTHGFVGSSQVSVSVH
ncbi:MAG TPA: hypothetical protein VEL79_11660 [Vicinamibacterales bacterium]|nr:hypothetical protein [Vicinamibacterales bacterium]